MQSSAVFQDWCMAPTLRICQSLPISRPGILQFVMSMPIGTVPQPCPSSDMQRLLVPRSTRSYKPLLANRRKRRNSPVANSANLVRTFTFFEWEHTSKGWFLRIGTDLTALNFAGSHFYRDPPRPCHSSLSLYAPPPPPCSCSAPRVQTRVLGLRCQRAQLIDRSSLCRTFDMAFCCQAVF